MMDVQQAYDNEASLGYKHDVHILLPNGMVLLKPISSSDENGQDLTVNQTKALLVEDLHLENIDHNTVSLILRKGKVDIVMNNNEKTVEYIKYFTDQYLLEIKLN